VNAQPAPVSAADPASADESVWLQSVRDIVSDLFQRSPLIYWTDFLASITITLGLNLVRNLAAHGYVNPGERMTYVEQVGDSVNITGQHWLTVLLFPVSLRYHALHHLFPALPYRNLGEAHRRLTERLPPDAPYHATGRASFFAAASELWRSARQTPREDSAMRRWNP
jgi:fatty acid desaturase